MADGEGGDHGETVKSRAQSDPGAAVPIEIDEVEEVDDRTIAAASPPPPGAPVKQTQLYRAVAPPTAVRPPVPPPTPRVVPIPPPRPPGGPAVKPPAIPIPAPRATAPMGAVSPPVVSIPGPPPRPPAITPMPAMPRTKTNDHPSPPPPPPPSRTPTSEQVRLKRPSAPPPAGGLGTSDDILAGIPDITKLDSGVEVGTATPNVAVDQPLEALLEHPTVVDNAIAALASSDAGGGEQRAEAMSRELEAKLLSDPPAAAFLAYELGELYERRLADEARAVKAYGRAVNLDPSLRANLWAIRRVFYRRALWPNLAKLVDAEVQYARDDSERADLLLEKARVHAHRMNDVDEARSALDEAARIAPQHEGVLLELERMAAKANDTPALLEVWELLAEAAEQPARKLSYWLEVARAAATSDAGRAHTAFDRAAAIAAEAQLVGAAERVARERLRVAEDGGAPDDIVRAIDALADVLLAAFGPAGPASDPTEQPERATRIRRELVALRRRQAQLVRADKPERAWEILQLATALVPGEPILLTDLTELAEELGRYEDLAMLVQSWQAVEADPSRALALSIRRVDALLRGGKRDAARALLASLEASAPGFVVLTSVAERDALLAIAARAASGEGGDIRAELGELARAYLAAAHAAQLGTHLGGATPQPDPRAAAALYVQAAELLAYELATPESIDEARAALGKALEAAPGDAAALAALTELDDATGQVEPALARLRDAARAADGDDRRGLLEHAIRVARGHGALDTMVELERELIAAAPGVPEATAARWRLESTLSQLGRDDERADVLVQIAADETDATGRGTALLAAARLRERAGNVESATELYRQVVALWPEDTFARESLLDLLRAQERWTELVTERRSEARTLPDGPPLRRALREAAWVLEIRLGDAAAAAQVYDEWVARMPEDRAALEGVARCRAATGDRRAVVAARAAIAGEDPSADVRWLYASALERAGELDESAEQLRALIARPDEHVASNAAAVALLELSAARGDTVMRVEAGAALATRTADGRLGAALAEDSGWMYALALEDFERAAQSFVAALELEPGRRGALLGAALVAARSGDQNELARAYASLAEHIDMPDASAALLLRSSAMAVAAGDGELANARAQAARHAAPDDTSALLVLAETTPPPIVDTGDPGAMIDQLLARAELLEMRGALADDAAASASWELDRAEVLELAGRVREAGSVVAAVLKTRPDDLRALAALRRMARRVEDRPTAAQAAYTLARVLGDRDAKLALFREAAEVFDTRGLHQSTDYAIAAYKRILALEPGAPEHERLLGLLRERADVRTLVTAITDRLTWLESEGRGGEEPVPLLLERATVLHGLGDQQAAMADLDALLEQSPNNIEALRFRGDLALNTGDVDTTIAMWRRYLAAETRGPRRAEIELQLSQVLAENTGDLAGAIEQLERVVAGNPEDLLLHERLLGLCTRAGDWNRAVNSLRMIAKLKPTPQDKAREELRIALLLRDRANDRVGARLALDRARALDPLNLDAVRELSELLDPAQRVQMFAAAATTFREHIAQNPKQFALYERLAQLHAWQSEIDARWLALVAVEALSTPTMDQRQVIAQGRTTITALAPRRVKLDERERAALRGGHSGAFAELWRAIAPSVQVVTGVEPGKLGFGRGDKIALKKLGEKHAPLTSALQCFGIEELELYVNGARAGFARALAADPPILLLGSDVASASTQQHRFLLGRAVAMVAEGAMTLPDLHDGELEWTIIAALRACEAPIPPALAATVSSESTALAERAKLLKKELSRKAKATVLQIAMQKPQELADIELCRRRTLAVGHRAGLLWCGDLAVALAMLDVGKGGRELVDSPAALELVAWSVSEPYLKLREKLGLALAGMR